MPRYTHRRADLLARGFYTDRTKARIRNRANLYLDGELFGRIQEIVAPRVLKIGFKVDF